MNETEELKIKIFNCFIKFLPTKMIDDIQFYVLRDDELRINEEILNICIDNNEALVKYFPNNNWSNIRKAKKRIMQTIKNCLKIFEIEIIKKQISYDAIREDGSKYPSTMAIYIFQWNDEKINIGKFNISDYTENKNNNYKNNKKEYHKEYYFNNKEKMKLSHTEYMNKRYNRN